MRTIKRILLVEDDLDDQMFFCEALNKLQSAIECRIANDGVEALELVEEPPPFDLIFLDLNMPKVNGFECLKRLKDHPIHKEIPVVILSTSNHPEDITKSKLLGAAHFMSKTPALQDFYMQISGTLNNLA